MKIPLHTSKSNTKSLELGKCHGKSRKFRAFLQPRPCSFSGSESPKSTSEISLDLHSYKQAPPLKHNPDRTKYKSLHSSWRQGFLCDFSSGDYVYFMVVSTSHKRWTWNSSLCLIPINIQAWIDPISTEWVRVMYFLKAGIFWIWKSKIQYKIYFKIFYSMKRAVCKIWKILSFPL